MSADDFDAIRTEVDPVRRARLATELLAVYGQRSIELARLRKSAIDQAHDDLGMTYTEVAAKIGLTKGRVTQIRKTAPPVERAFFGIGPVTIAVPVRVSDDRSHGVITVEDSIAADQLAELLGSLSLAVDRYQIPPGGQWEPPADAIAICGPKSSPVTASVIAADPLLRFEPDRSGQWVIADRADGRAHVSPTDLGDPTSDIAYVARLHHEGRRILVLAGVHALGSIGAVEHLRRNLAAVHAAVGEADFSLVVASSFDGTTATSTTAVWGPTVHP